MPKHITWFPSRIQLALFGLVILLMTSILIALPARAAIAFRSASSASNGGTTTLNIPLPAGVAVGDVLIITIDFRHYTGASFFGAPAGITEINRATDNSTLAKRTYYAVMTSTPPASYTFTFFTNDTGGTTSVKASGGIVAYTGVDQTNPIMANAIQINGATPNLTAPSVTTTAPNAMIIAMFGTAVGTTIAPGSSMTERYEAASSGGNGGTRTTSQGQDIIQAASGVSGIKTAEAVGAAVNIGHTVALASPASYSQASYRWFNNQDSTDVGTPLAAQNTSATAPSPGAPFRLRMNVAIADNSAASGAFKLQYAKRGTDNVCDTGFSGETYQDISKTTAQAGPGSGVNDMTVGTFSWSSPQNVLTDDTSYSTISSDGSANLGASYYLKATGFGFSIPNEATITGVTAEFNMRAGSLAHRAFLVKSGTVLTGHSKSVNVNSTFAYRSVGSDADMWATTWTPAEINSTGFGAAINLFNDGVAASSDVDNIRLTVAYNIGGIQYYDNATPANASAVTANVSDPTDGRTLVRQTYQESNPFNIATSIPAGQDGLWDFALTLGKYVEPGSYCFRAVTSTGSVLSTYSQVPELAVQSAVSQENWRAYEPGTASAAEWWNTSWQNRRKITLNNSASTENLINFPARISLSSANIDYAKVQNAGQDIRLVDADGTTLLSHEIETWNETGNSEVWAKVPQLDAGSTTDFIWMYYNNTSATDGQNSALVWNNNFEAVWHMKEDPTATQPAIKDSTAGAKHGTASGMTAARQVPGKINGALEYDGLDGVVATPVDTIPTTATYETWMRYDTAGEGGLGRILHKGTTTTSTYLLTDYVIGRELIFKSHRTTTAGEWRTPANSVPDDGQLHHIVVTYDNSSTANAPIIYIDGSPVALTTITSPVGDPIINTEPWHIGNNSVGDRTADGVMDEVRISNTVRSSEWVEAQYQTMANGMNTFSSEELTSYPVPGAPLAAENTTAAITAGTSFRLRQLLEQKEGSSQLDAGSYKVQYATKSGTCDVGFSGEVYQNLYVSTGGNQLEGPFSAMDDFSNSGNPWNNIDFVTISDDVVANVTFDGTNIPSAYLKATNFGFTIPSNATITGVEAFIEGHQSGTGGVYTEEVVLVKNNTLDGAIIPSGAWLANTDSVMTQGSPTSLWGATIAPADVNATGFGFAFSVLSSEQFSEARVDSVEMKVYYTVPAAGTPALAYHTTSGIASAATISTHANDPTATGTIKPQTFVSTDPFKNSVSAIAFGESAMWDFAVSTTAEATGSYCFRVVKSDSSLLANYSRIPEITIAGSGGGGPATPTLDQQLRGGQSLVNGTRGRFIW